MITLVNYKMKKSILELAWNVPESEYRAGSGVSYSMLATFEREGAKAIPTIGAPKSSAALRFGSIVDTLLTDEAEFENKFLVADISKTSETIIGIVNKIFEATEGATNDLASIPLETMMIYINDANYQSNWKDETRANAVVRDGKDYFALLALAGDKTIITQMEYNDGLACVEALKTHPYVSKYFTDPFFVTDEIESHYQLKFKYCDNTIDVRCMYDRLQVNHTQKTIQPLDLKTTGKDEEEFEHSFLAWSYWIQSSMYSQILRWVCDMDDYFKDFTILPFKFVVINRYNRTPMTWVDNNNLVIGERIDNHGTKHKHWLQLYNEFKWHVANEKYNYSYDTYMNDGLRTLENIKVYDSGITEVL